MLIENVVVAPDYRRQGVGRGIMLHLEGWALENGCGFITLVSQRRRSEAHQFYSDLGYAHDEGYQKIFSNQL
jgi:GNAT superfamily N-acetyltransferase